MRINYYPIRNFDVTSTAGGAAGLGALGAAGPVGLALGGLQTALGIFQGIRGSERAQRALRKAKAYRTPEELLDLAKFDQSRVGSGLDPQTLHYLTGNADNALSTSLNTAARLGGDPNQFSNLLDQRFLENMKFGAENQRLNLINYGNFRESMRELAASDAAEQKSRQDLSRNELAAAGAEQQQSVPNFLGGGNTILNTLAAANTANLFSPPTPTPVAGNRYNPSVELAPLQTQQLTGPVRGRSTPDLSGFNFSQTQQMTPENLRQYLDLLNQMNKIRIGQ